jgi:hypothetical protein
MELIKHPFSIVIVDMVVDDLWEFAGILVRHDRGHSGVKCRQYGCTGFNLVILVANGAHNLSLAIQLVWTQQG